MCWWPKAAPPPPPPGLGAAQPQPVAPSQATGQAQLAVSDAARAQVVGEVTLAALKMRKGAAYMARQGKIPGSLGRAIEKRDAERAKAPSLEMTTSETKCE